MHTIVGVTTFNPVSTMRLDLLERTVRSIEKAFPTAVLCLLSNGSTDGSEEAINELCGERWQVAFKHPSGGYDGYGHEEHTWSPGAGRSRLLAFMRFWSRHGRNEVFVWSDDDMYWRGGAQETLERFWHDPEVFPKLISLAVVSGLLEPRWHWNTPRSTLEHNGIKALVRDSVPGAAFTFVNNRLVPPQIRDEETFGYDHKICKRLHNEGFRAAALDLAEHIGWGRSTHGNRAIDHVQTRPLDRERWGV
jgi:hypothetical protein